MSNTTNHSYLAINLQGADPLHPLEDACSVNATATVLAVADGVTRTPSGGTYPMDSPASHAADIFCQVVQTELTPSSADKQSILHAFTKANAAILAYNTQAGLADTDYYERDLAGTVAALAIIQGNHVHYGYIGDCAIGVLGKNGNLTFRTANDVTDAAAHWPPRAPDVSPKDRQIQVRRDFRNQQGTPPYGYGVLTGEPTALAYIKTNALRLQTGDTLLVFSDGAEALLGDPQGRKVVQSLSQTAVEAFIRAKRDTQEFIFGADTTLLAARVYTSAHAPCGG